MIDSTQALELAFARGKLKKWALEGILLDMLYKTEPSHCSFVKLKDVDKYDFDEETEKEYIVKFGYQFQIPRTELDLHIVKSDGMLYLTKEGIGYGYDEVEKEVINYLMKYKASKNLYLRTNYNGMEFLIK